jgi:hypothetical protein
MPQNGEYLWTARPFARFVPPSSIATGRPRVAPWWEWAVRWLWNLEGDFWRWWYEASGQRDAFDRGVAEGERRGADHVRREIRRGIEAVVERNAP